MASMLAQGLELLVYGMGTVVVFLSLLVYATRAMSWFVQRYLPDPEPLAAPSVVRAPPVPTAAGPSAAQLAAITAALHVHRRRA